jgi:Raf kinase inhibitor-like YbhB/YbcL family protein
MKTVLLLALAAPLCAAPFTVTSPAFAPGGTLPAEFTCDGERASPPLQWSNAPAGTRSFAVTMHHVPGPGDRHVYLVIYNIPATVTSLAKNSRTAGSWGVNTVNGQAEYTPPCSQGPGPKTYTLTVYALSAEAKLSGTVTMEALLNAIQDKTLATAAIDVTYSRAGRDGGQPRRPGPRLPAEMDGALAGLTLTPDQKEAVQAIVQQFGEKQRQRPSRPN